MWFKKETDHDLIDCRKQGEKLREELQLKKNMITALEENTRLLNDKVDTLEEDIVDLESTIKHLTPAGVIAF